RPTRTTSDRLAPLKVLVVHAHPSPTSYSRAVCAAAVDGVWAAGHDVTIVHLDDEGFRPAMSTDERRAYESPEPILDPQVARHADLVRCHDALVFVYPTWWAGQPAIL